MTAAVAIVIAAVSCQKTPEAVALEISAYTIAESATFGEAVDFTVTAAEATNVTAALIKDGKQLSSVTIREAQAGVFAGTLAVPYTKNMAGGQYDGMVKKLGKKCDGIGFAIYLSEMSRIPLKQQEYDVEALILYDETADFSQLILQANSLIKQGMRVRVERQLPNQLRCEKLYRFEKGELKELDREAVAAEKEVQ